MHPKRTLGFGLLALLVFLSGVGCKRTVRVEPNEIPSPETTTPTPPAPGTPPNPATPPAPTSPTTPVPNEQTPRQQTRLRVIHAAAGDPAVDIHLGESAAIRKLSYKAASPYTSLPAGKIAARVTPAGGSAPVLGPAALDLARGGTYTVAALGSGQDRTFGILILADDPAPPAAGRAKVRLIHAVPDAPALDMLLDDRIALSNLTYGRATGVYTELDAGSYPVTFAPTGAPGAVLGPLPLTLQAGRTYTLVVMGRTRDRSLNLQVYTDN